MLYTVTSLDGTTEPLTGLSECERKFVVNGEITFSFKIHRKKTTEHCYHLVDHEHLINGDGLEFRIKKVTERLRGKRDAYKKVECHHVFFDTVDEYQYKTRSNTQPPSNALFHIFEYSEWRFSNRGAFNSVVFENFGRDNVLSMFHTFLNRYGAEFKLNTASKIVEVYNRIGTERHSQFRWNHNVKTLSKEIDTSNLSTYIRGYGHTNEETGEQVTAEYTSPNAHIYRDHRTGEIKLKHAPVVEDDRFHHESSLREHLEKTINDEPEVTIEIELAELYDQEGAPLHPFELGDSIYLLIEPLNIQAKVRVLEYTDFPFQNRSPEVVLSNLKTHVADVWRNIESHIQNTSKRLRDITDADGNISLQIRNLYRNSYVYSDHSGDWYFAEDDPDAYVHIGSGGIDVKKGLIRVERADGYPIIIGGMLTMDLEIQSHEPYLLSPGVTVENPWFATENRTQSIAQYYTFEHKSRFLNFRVINRVEDGGRMYVTLEEETENQGEFRVLASLTSTSTGGFYDDKDAVDMRVDLGTPTGRRRHLYLRFRSLVDGKKAYVRTSRRWLEG